MSDHIPIVMELDLEVDEWAELPHPNFRLAEWKGVRELLTAKLTALGLEQETRTLSEFYEWVSALMQVISEVIDVRILKGGLLPHKKWWWFPMLTVKWAEVHRIMHRA